MTCPPAAVDDYVHVFASDAYAVGTQSAPSNPLFWFYEATTSSQASVYPTWDDTTTSESLTSRLYNVKASDIGTWYITFTEATAGSESSNDGVWPQWVI